MWNLVSMRVTFALRSFFSLLKHHHHLHPLLNMPLLFLTPQGQSRRRSAAAQLDRSRLPKENHPPPHLLFLAVSPLRGDTRRRPPASVSSRQPPSNTHRPTLDSLCPPPTAQPPRQPCAKAASPVHL